MVALGQSLAGTVVALAVFFSPLVAGAHVSTKPSALHLVKDDDSSVRCLWYTPSLSGIAQYGATCQYGFSPFNLSSRASGRSYSYTAGGFNGSLHEVLLAQLPSNRPTYYQCGSSMSNVSEWSDVKHFVLRLASVSEEAALENMTWIGVIGDMGVDDSKHTIDSLQRQSQAANMDLVVHGGDISYADDYFPSHTNSHIWVKYMQEVESFAASSLYMTCPGNHEAQFDFAAYNNWLPMPSTNSKSSSPYYYSFDHGGIHFTMMSTEHDFSPGSLQYQWLEKDLEKASLGRNLGVPWLVVVGHRPLYCSSVTVSRRCTEEAPQYREWLEGLLHRYKVDAYICGHNHQYERSYPVYNMTVSSTSYVKPEGTVYIVNGAAGNPEHNDPNFMPQKDVPWRATHGKGLHTGWLRMRANSYLLQFEYLLSDTGEIADFFVISR